VKRSGDARFAYDSYRRFIQMYGNVVLDIDHHESRRSWRLISATASSSSIRFESRGLAGRHPQLQKVVEHTKGKPFPRT